MKKIISIFLILTLVLSLLAGCANKVDEDVTPTPPSEPTPTLEPTPEPGPIPTEVHIESAEYGDIALTVPAGIAVEIAEPGVKSLGALTKDYYGDFSISSRDMVTQQKAHIHADGVNMVVGYTDYSNEIYKTFSNAKYYQRALTLEEIAYGGEDGYCFVTGTLMLAFPATTQYAARMISIYPDEMPENNGSSDLDEWLYLLELPWVAEILASLQFTGEQQNEAKWETELVDVKTFSLTPVDGWEVQELTSQICLLKKEGASDWFTSNDGAAQISIWSWSLSSAVEALQVQLESQFTPLEQLDNIFINGREFFLLKAISEDSSITGYVLITSWAETFEPDVDGYVMFELQYSFDLDAAMMQLENITIK